MPREHTKTGYRIVRCDGHPAYRYSLTLETDVTSSRRLVVIQCNPSNARADRSDPTVGKVAIWAREHQFKEVVFLNLFALVSSTKSELAGKTYKSLVGSRNDRALRQQIRKGTAVVLAWGSDIPVPDEIYEKRVAVVRRHLKASKIKPFHVGALVRQKYPRHGRAWNKGNRNLCVLDWVDIEAH